MEALVTLPIVQYAHEPLLRRMWQLRGQVTAYDAAYVALAEGTRGTLVTRDARVAASVRGSAVRIEVL